MAFMIDLNLIVQSLPQIIHGTLITLQIAALSCCIGLILGIICGFGLNSSNTLIRYSVTVYTGIFRGIPMLIQIIFAAFVLPTMGINISTFWAVIWAIGLNSAAYIAHTIRSGIQSVGKGQIEAAKTLGLTRLQIMWHIILPQALRIVLPALGNEFITLVKDSCLASIVGVHELTKEGEIISSTTYDALTVYALIAIIYLTITTVLSLIVSSLEKRMNHANH
jgi:amine acid ABC transporter, permease protein, 3-TM region, His/Glu/Gln/Arg/opine family